MVQDDVTTEVAALSSSLSDIIDSPYGSIGETKSNQLQQQIDQLSHTNQRLIDTHQKSVDKYERLLMGYQMLLAENKQLVEQNDRLSIQVSHMGEIQAELEKQSKAFGLALAMIDILEPKTVGLQRKDKQKIESICVQMDALA